MGNIGRAVLLVGIAACSSHGSGSANGTPDGGTNGGAGWTVSYGSAATLFGLKPSTIFQYQDVTGDGDYNEPGEQTTFYKLNGPLTVGLTALNSHTVVASVENNPMPPYLTWLEDMNGNGTAMDPGEAHTWWSGGLPGGGSAAEISDITSAPDGSVYVLVDLDITVINDDAIYKLNDVNGNGTVDDPGDVTLVAKLSGLGAKSITVAGDGDIWFVAGSLVDNTAGLYRVPASAPAIAFDAPTLMQAGFRVNGVRMATLADGSVALVSTPDLASEELVALRDANMDGQITIDELVRVWTTADGDFPCTFDDLRGLADGTAVCLGGDVVLRMSDGNADGTFLDDGETYVVYDPTFSGSNALPDAFEFISAVVD
jgi:hypothetical protein